MEYILETQGLCKHYRGFRALDSVNMRIPRGAIYGLVGKNGAGKTTLIRLLCGLQQPSAGSFTLYGAKNDSPRIFAARRRMGAVVETPSLYLGMTARENLCQQFRILGIPSFAEVEALLRLVRLADTGKKRVRNFSLGMRQRLGIAVALAGSPDFLVLDEPVNGLDPEGIVEMRELLLRLNRESGITILISSHILSELSRLATCYGILDGGRMLREVRAEELEAKCRHCLRVTVTDTRALATALDEMQTEYAVYSDTSADIYGKVNISRLCAALSARGCEVHTVHEQDESLESYFMNLVGGGKDA